MKKSRLLLVTFLISSLLAPQVLAETDAAAQTEILAETDTPAASPVITAGGPSVNVSVLSTVTSAPSTVYPAGTYTVGTNIPAGEYVLLTDQLSADGQYIIYKDSSEDADYIDFNVFSYNAIIRLDDGQVLELQKCAASPIDEVSQIDHFYGQMYKIGYHIPAGTYQLKALDSDSYGVAYVLSYPSDNSDVVEDYTYVEDTAAVMVRDGQYLQLTDCILSGVASESDVKENHGSQSGSWYEDQITAGAINGDDQRTSLVTVGTLVPGLPTVTSVPTTVYQPGTYQVGVDLPAGEYVLFGTYLDLYDLDLYGDSSAGSYMISTVSEPASLDQITDSGLVLYNTIIRVEEGQFLNMEQCTASPILEVPKLDYRKGTYFKVGYHIPAGTYHFKPDSVYGSVFVLSAPTQQYKDVADYEVTALNSDTVTMTVQDGQYLLIFGCRFTGADTSKAYGPGGKPTDPATSAYIDYLKQLYGYEEEETPSKVITVPQPGHALSATTSAPSTVYREELYQAGATIPAGEYMLLFSDSSANANSLEDLAGYAITTVEEPTEYDQVLDYSTFSYNAIVHISEGQYLHLQNCTASPIDEVPQLDFSRGQMYRVGLQLPEGTYRLKYIDTGYSYGRAYILSHPSDNYEDVMESYAVSDEEDTVITVMSGQYLQLKNCIVTESVDPDGSTGGPAFAAADDTQEKDDIQE